MFNMESKTEEAPIEKGDAVIILKKDGSVVPMTFGIDEDIVSSASEKTPDEMTDEEIAVTTQGTMMFLLAMAANSDQIMQFLAGVSAAVGRDDNEKMRQVAFPN